MKRNLLILILTIMLFLVGCSKDQADPIPGIKPQDRGPDTEPTATYDWMAGECPFSNARVGKVRDGLNRVAQAVGPNGIYFIENGDTASSFIVYADHGSDTFVKLCGRIDCTHNSSDCNAYLPYGSALTFYRGYLYAVSGGSANSQYVRCELIRMEPDGSDRVTVLDMDAFSKETDAEFSSDVRFFDGNCMFLTNVWETTASGSIKPQGIALYRYKLDGSMDKPVSLSRMPSYYSGDMLYCIGPPKDSESLNGIWTMDIDSGIETFIVDQVGLQGVYMHEEVYFFKDGAIRHRVYATNEETVLVETGLEHDYSLFAFPDCLVLADKASKEDRDPNLYIYNWAFELVDTVELTYSFNGSTQFMLIAETAEQLILTDSNDFFAMPRYYIDKSELGTGNAKVHEYKYA